MKTQIPGPKSLQASEKLRRYECQNITYMADDWPVFWQRAAERNVWDVDGNRFLDFTSAFGVAGMGHGSTADAMVAQAGQLVHGMGDVHPTELKAQLCEQLSKISYERWGLGIGKSILSNSGFEAVESALKTALVKTGKAGIVSFKNGYHGLGYGALLSVGLARFKEPFSSQLAEVSVQLTFPRTADDLTQLASELEKIDASQMGALIVEPIQGRGGKVVPPAGFLAQLRAWCDANGVVLIYDEIYTGFYRTGKLFACEWQGVFPDLICVGKALSGGYPISACIGTAEVMDAWPVSPGEALHTSTFLGNPVGCAMALEALRQLDDDGVGEMVLSASEYLVKQLEQLAHPSIKEVRGRGLMIGAELVQADGSPDGALAGKILSEMLAAGVLMLADGDDGNVLAFVPPFSVTHEEIDFVIGLLSTMLPSHD
ncbi:aspartate aminotransferase family protein [Persicirhabdus sediminis]|uniref:aspartate aminotransferase family protein n=1 Tax=Persicirhabdus sediminis TaxID=454144 RepID=UPI001F40E471|nr:aspartate aminotransferase family protein [Persicirhabdus sediminis]